MLNKYLGGVLIGRRALNQVGGYLLSYPPVGIQYRKGKGALIQERCLFVILAVGQLLIS